jgi:hypothetical protein
MNFEEVKAEVQLLQYRLVALEKTYRLISFDLLRARSITFVDDVIAINTEIGKLISVEKTRLRLKGLSPNLENSELFQVYSQIGRLYNRGYHFKLVTTQTASNDLELVARGLRYLAPIED